MFSGNVEIELCAQEEAQSLLPSGVTEILNDPERKQFEKFRSPKRRQEWFAGRLAAKRLVRRKLGGSGSRISLQDIRILARESGEPCVELPPSFEVQWRYPLSISHSGRYAVAALAGVGKRVGADVETVAPREKSWLELVAHDSEIFPGLREDAVGQTVLWTLKEAVVKALGVGLSVGFSDVRFLRGAALGASRLEFHGKARRIWEDMGRPDFAFESAMLDDRSAISVAYTCSD